MSYLIGEKINEKMKKNWPGIRSNMYERMPGPPLPRLLDGAKE